LMMTALLLAMIMPVRAEENTENGPEVSGQAAILVDMASGSILYKKNIDQHLDPASLTKIMTVYAALEKTDIDAELTLSKEAFGTYSHDYGVLWIQEGETMTARSAAYASLLASANDTTAMLSEAAAGSVDAMVPLMNQKARELGLGNTNFQNPFGLNNENNYTTARDMAALTRTVLQDDDFARMFGASSYTIPASNKYGERLIAQDCELLRSGNLAYGPATACKVGSTEYGGYAITVAAEKDGSGLIAVVLGAPDMASVYADAVRLLDYGFASFRTILVSEEEIGTKTIEVKNGRRHVADVTFTAESGFRILLPAGIDPELITTDIRISNEDSPDPEKIEAEVLFLLDGTEVGSAKMKKTIERTDFQPQAGTASRIRLYFDYFCVLVLAMFLFRRVMRVVHRLLAPPQ
ncbi:MAG: D-alanyl-D-alanine carboxypeptidase, partial [Solobacterium sp.]|nr:D-alanyl-D-alanine carboxypeptidase [Solobacterium sp.]